ncbi:MAG: ATP-binding protein [Pseudomonadota bacterium]
MNNRDYPQSAGYTPNNASLMEPEKKKRRRELAVVVFGVLLIGFIFYMESRIARTAEDVPFGSHLLLFSLLLVVTLLLILVFFFLIRNIFKLVFERRSRVLGSHLKARLSVAFMALTLVPTAVLFIASAGVLHNTIERWFKSQVEESLQSSLVVAQAYYQMVSDNLTNVGSRLAEAVAAKDLLGPGKGDDLRDAMRSWVKAERISGAQVYFQDRSPVGVGDAEGATPEVPFPRPSFVNIGLRGNKTAQIVPLEGGGDLVRAVVPVRSRTDDNLTAALIVDWHIPTSLAGRLFVISNAYGDYQEALRMRGPVKTIYALVLLMVSLLVMVIGSWFGITIARDITEPIQHLAEGTDKIAGGDLDVYIEPLADDELGVLVRSFNKMTADLRAYRDDMLLMNLDLESRRKYMETVLKNVAAGVLALGPDNVVTAINKSAMRMLGISEAYIPGKDLMDVLPEASVTPMSEVIHDVRSMGSPAIERHINVSLPDRTVSLLCFANSLKDDEGRDLGLVLVLEDLTHLIRAQRMAAWRDVARRIAHEIKNPLTPIQLNAQRIRRKYLKLVGEDGEVLDRCTQSIVDQVEQLKKMVNEFSLFARMPAANPVPNDLNAVISEVVEFYAQGSDRIRFRFDPDPAVPVFDLDKEQMKRALINLLDNAQAAVNGPGQVGVSTRYDPELAMVTIEVADTGIGVTPQDKDRLFEPYFSRKPGGTGLGLTIVSTIVADHNGFIRVKTNPDGGARFVMEFPVRKGAEPTRTRLGQY